MIRRAATNRVLNVLRHWVTKHIQVGGALLQEHCLPVAVSDGRQWVHRRKRTPFSQEGLLKFPREEKQG